MIFTIELSPKDKKKKNALHQDCPSLDEMAD
jgi:hypothetical protein